MDFSRRRMASICEPDERACRSTRASSAWGCRTEGDDLADAKRMAKEAIEAWLSVDRARSDEEQSLSGRVPMPRRAKIGIRVAPSENVIHIILEVRLGS